MAVDNVVKSRKRYASNILWMTALLEYMINVGIPKDTSPDTTPDRTLVDTTLTSWTQALEGNLTNSLESNVSKILQSTENPELIGFRNVAFTRLDGTYRYDSKKLNEQIDFEIKCLPAQTKNLAIQGKAPDPSETDATWLNRILTLMYLTRKVVAVFEAVCEDTMTGEYIQYAYTDAPQIYAKCTQVRSSTFSTRAPMVSAVSDSSTVPSTEQNKTLHDWAVKMARYYKEWGEKAGAPFYGNHRFRDKKAVQMHRDDLLLSVWAGTHKVPVDSERSVLGMVERVFNLPERCDISGTTTDAVGYGVYKENLPGTPANPDLFVFLNIYGMIISAHHSLFETCAGASLWSSEFYAPFEPLSILDVLGNLYNKGDDIQGIQPTVPSDRKLKNLYSSLQTVVSDTHAQKDDLKLQNTYWYVRELWQDLAGMALPGIPDKTLYWGENLEMSQPLYVMAEKLCGLASHTSSV